MRPPRPLLAALLAAILWAGEGREARAVEKTANEVAAAFKAGGADAVRPIVEATDRDLWLVAEHLAGEGEMEAAKALGAAAGRKHAMYERLPAYVQWRAENPPSTAEIKELHEVSRLMTARRFLEAIALLEKTPDTSGGVTSARRLRLVAWVREGAKHPTNEVLAAYDKAIDACRELGWLSATMIDRERAVTVAKANKQYDTVLQLVGEGLPVAEKLAARPFERRLRWHAAFALRAQARYEDALPYARRAYELAEGTRQKRTYLELVLMLEIPSGYTYAARRNLDTMHRLDRELGNTRGMAASRIQMASLDINLGRPNSALAGMQKALEWFETHGKPAEIRGVNLHAGKIWLNLGRPRRALVHLDRALEVGKGLGYNDATLLHFKGLTLIQLKRASEAEQTLLQALREARNQTLDARISTRTGLAHAIALQGRHKEALDALEIARGLGGKKGAGRGLDVVEARVRLRAGDLDGAIAAARRGLAKRREGLVTRIDAFLEGRIAEAWLRKGEPAKALAHARTAIGFLVRTTGALPAEVGAYHRYDFRHTWFVAIEAAAQLGDGGGFFEVSELARALALRTRMDAHEIATQALAPELREEEEKLEEAESLAVRAYRRALAAGEPDRVKSTFAALKQVRGRLENHRVRIRAEQAVVGQVLSPDVDALGGTRERLASDEALVVYASARKHFHALVATKTGVRIVDLGDREALAAAAEAVVFEDPSLSAAKSASTLRTLLVDPLALPDAIRRVTIVPSGPVAYVPFAALIPDHAVALEPSATVGRMLAARTPAASRKVLAVGTAGTGLAGPLPAAADEARAVGTTVLVGKQATEDAVRRALASEERWRAVHLACHGLMNTSNALRSALSLVPSGERDGLWTMSEILGTRVQADLVALSACSSAKGMVFHQEGVIGFVHAFFVAGAKRVLVSLWDVDDEATAALMKGFYAAWTDTTDAASALQKAQAAVRADARWKHPAYWAGWQLWGAP